MPKVSIIIPVYQVENYIRRCIDSILSQTFTDFEVLLVDDGSPDNCGKICDEYANKDERIKVFHQNNQGLAMARNAGLKHAKGDYILFCDSDDYVSKNWCKNLINCISSDEIRFIFGGINVVYETDYRKAVNLNVPEDSENRRDVIEFIDLQLSNKMGFAWNVLFVADIIRKHKLLFSNEYVVEDLPFIIRYLEYVDCLYYSGEANYFYYQDMRDTLSRKYFVDGFKKWREKYCLSRQFIENRCSGQELLNKRILLADSYLYVFLEALDNSFDPRNPASFIKKIQYNQKVVESSEFQDCLKWAKHHNEDRRILWFLRKKMYPIAWALNKIAFLIRR